MLNERTEGSANSVAVIIRHLNGNMMSRWTDFLTSDGEKPWRDRVEEFEEVPATRTVLLKLWNDGWDQTFATIESLQAYDLNRRITIRGESLTVTDAILRQLAHYAYHVGQIVHQGKMLKGKAWVPVTAAGRK
jgi:hypothetical protein